MAIERVTCPARNLGTTIVANLFKPAGFDANRKYAAVVVTHPFGGVKEQTAGLYALRLAEEGFLTLAYDASYQGESGGEPRLMEVPAQRLDDISCAIDFLVRHPQVDAGRIGSLGTCAGGSYALCNATTEMRVKTVAAVRLFNLGEARRGEQQQAGEDQQPNRAGGAVPQLRNPARPQQQPCRRQTRRIHQQQGPGRGPESVQRRQRQEVGDQHRSQRAGKAELLKPRQAGIITHGPGIMSRSE